MTNFALPSEIITSPEDKSVVLTPEITAALPGVTEAFRTVDSAFLSDPEAYLARLEDTTFTFRSSKGADVACSLIRSQESITDELLVIFAPFSDRDPKSSAKTLHDYVSADSAGGFIDKEKAAPNSWNQTTKSLVTFELLAALGNKVPVLTMYGPISSGAYGLSERAQLRNGDFGPAARLAKEAISDVESRMHGISGDTKINKIHLSGASLGAHNAIGAGNGLIEDGFDVRSVTAQELILGPKSLSDLAKRFTVSQHVGVDSEATMPVGSNRIQETAIRRTVDHYGSELLGTNARMIKGMKPTYMMGLTKPEATVHAVERLLDHEVAVLVALAENSSLTHQTEEFLPGSGEHVVRLRAEQGQKLGHMANEHVALTALVTALGVTRQK